MPAQHIAPLSPELATTSDSDTVPATSALVALHALGSGMRVAATAVSALLAAELDFGVPPLFVALLMGFLGFAIVSAGEGVVSLLWKVLGALFGRLRLRRGVTLLQAVPPVPVGRILGAFIYIAGDLLWPDSFLQHILLPVAGEIAIVLIGLAAMAVALAWMEERGRGARLALLALPAVLALAFFLWLADPGFDDYLVKAPAVAATVNLSREDPGASGPFTVQTLTYGSGNSSRRPEYGAAADLTTSPVDGSALFAGYGGIIDAYFRWYWGFNFDALPLNGLVWYPEGAGPFPLVLIVHGNHAMSDYSEPGYAYLGEHLANHGYIAVSVDENFLNGLVFFDGEFAEMPLRSWLLLQHLSQWRLWNETPGNPFAGKVDLDRVALIGHSRGGEAVAWAAHLNWRAMAPVSMVSRPEDFGFGIRAVVAIAPSDAYAGPGSRKPALDHSNYLLLAGGHDADTFVLYGQRQYNRIRLQDNPGGFKALAYVYQANHGQFNSVWSSQDRGLFNSLLLNRAPLLPAAAQQQAAKVLVTAFLHASLRDEAGYRALFRNPPAPAWLPAGIVVTQYQEQGALPIENFGNHGQSEISEAAAGMALTQVEPLVLRDGESLQQNTALHLGWESGSQPSYELALPASVVSGWRLTPNHALAFSLANAPGKPALSEVMVELETAAGVSARLPLSSFGPLLPSLPAHLVKASWLAGLNGFPDDMEAEEIVLQSYTLPLSAFVAANPAFQPEELAMIHFAFAGELGGSIYLDDIALLVR